MVLHYHYLLADRASRPARSTAETTTETEQPNLKDSTMRSPFFLTLLIACGGRAADGPPPPEEPPIDLHPGLFVPGQEGRTDGSVWVDGAFNNPAAKQEFCAAYTGDDAWFCDELGATRQAWTVAEYHGIEPGRNGGTCYGPNSKPTRDCWVPYDKYYTYEWTGTNCFTCDPRPPPQGIGLDCPTTLQEQAMHDGVVLGMKAWNGKGGAAMVAKGTSGTSGYVHSTIDCASTDPVAYGSGSLGPAVPLLREADLPVGPHGKDEGRGLSLNMAVLQLNVPNIWHYVRLACGASPSYASIVNTVASFAGHETGHMFGFGHFDATTMSTNIMYPFWTVAPSCNPVWDIQAEYANALSVFSPGATTDSIPNKGLSRWTPE